MKPLFILMTFVSSFFATSSFASDKVSAAARRSFETTFSTAKEAAWTSVNSYYKVQFLLSNQPITAFFTVDGKLLRVTRNISTLQLPVLLQAEIKNDYANQWVTDLREVSTGDGTEYYLTVEDADSRTILKSANNSFWSVHQKQKK